MNREIAALDSIVLKMSSFAFKIDQEEAIDEFHTIRKALKEKEKLEKVVNIIKTKKPFLNTLCQSENVDIYNDYAKVYGREKLTEEEYNLLMEVLK